MPPPDQLPAAYLALEAENATLRAQVAWLTRKVFGGSQSERLDRAQLPLALGELAAVPAPATPATVVSYERPAGRAEARTVPAATFAHLPVQETITLEPAEVQAEPAAFERIGEERTFEIDVVPPKLFKREIVRPKYRRKADRSQAPVVAPAPQRAVMGGYASAGLLAWIVLSKYVDHLPLYRLEQMSARWGAALPRQSMVEWVRLAAEWLTPLYQKMRRNLLAGGYVQVDETPVKCHDPDQRRGGTSQGFLWVLTCPGDDVVFEWFLSRQHNHLTKLLTDAYRGLLQSDGYAAYPAYAAAHPGVVWLACWAHARRKFFEAQAEQPKAMRVVLRLIARLYRLERQWDEAGVTPADRAELRPTAFRRTLAWLHQLAQQLRERALPQSLVGKACDYLLGHWTPLTAHLQHGRTKLDTNAVENAIRPSALGKKNWLFIGHPEAGQRSAIIYSIVASCRVHGKDPLAYLRDVLTRLPTMTTKDDLTPLLPRNWQPA
jgi:transposase